MQIPQISNPKNTKISQPRTILHHTLEHLHPFRVCTTLFLLNKSVYALLTNLNSLLMSQEPTQWKKERVEISIPSLGMETSSDLSSDKPIPQPWSVNYTGFPRYSFPFSRVPCEQNQQILNLASFALQNARTIVHVVTGHNSASHIKAGGISFHVCITVYSTVRLFAIFKQLQIFAHRFFLL